MTERDILAGRYELRGVLGRGGMAEVRDGWDLRLDRAVAVKLLHPVLGDQPELRARFESEARSAASLSHPHIVGVFDFGDHEGTPFIVMERLPGDTVHDLIARGPQPALRVQAILADILAALDFAHANGVLHRDIKPGNILVAADGATVKVGDFGIAKSAGMAHTVTGQIVGTMAYMSPERLAGAPASVGDDLYAVGIVGYEALTGGRAYAHDNPAALAHAIMTTPPTPLQHRPGVDPVLAQVIDRATDRDPHRRFRTAQQMRAALTGDHLAQQPARTTAPGPGHRAQRPPTRVLTQPVPPAGGHILPPASAAYVPPRRQPMSRNKKILAGAGALIAVLVTAIALAADPSPTSTTPEPAATSSVPLPPPTSAPPPTPTSVPATIGEQGPPVEDRRGGPGNKGDNKGRGNGNGKRE